LSTDGETVLLQSGDVAVFRGDQRHSCRNHGSRGIMPERL
jgi:quercetin dioxygenase-like cupin family protein